jgi:hypothetical protein
MVQAIHDPPDNLLQDHKIEYIAIRGQRAFQSDRNGIVVSVKSLAFAPKRDKVSSAETQIALFHNDFESHCQLSNHSCMEVCLVKC